MKNFVTLSGVCVCYFCRSSCCWWCTEVQRWIYATKWGA